MKRNAWLFSVLALSIFTGVEAQEFDCSNEEFWKRICWGDEMAPCCQTSKVVSPAPQNDTIEKEKPLSADDLAKMIEPLIKLWEDRLRLEMEEECKAYFKDRMPPVCKPYVEN